jgi:hypothetical protein
MSDLPENDLTSLADSISSDLFPVSEEGQSPESSPAPPATEPATPAAPRFAVPDSWRKEVHGLWPQLPETIQEEIHRREADFFKGIETYKGKAAYTDRLSQILSPYEQIFSQNQIDPLHLINNFLTAHYKLSYGSPEEKRALWAQFATDYGIDSLEDSGFVDPQVAALQKEISGLKSRLDGQAQQELQVRQAQIAQDVQSFATDPKNIYFAEVYQDMVALVQGGVAKDLQSAYEKAIWQNPVTREKELARVSEEKAAEAAKLRALAIKAGAVQLLLEAWTIRLAKPLRASVAAANRYSNQL